MPDDNWLEGSKFLSFIIGAGGGFSGFTIGVVSFFNRFQTKVGCKKAHDNYELLQVSRRETIDAKVHNIESCVSRIEDMVGNITHDLYEPRTAKTRKTDK